MNGRYQILYYVPDSLLGERVILGAIVRDQSGESEVIVREPAPLSNRLTGDRVAQYRALLSSLSQVDATCHLPSALGPDVELGHERIVPSQVAHAREWVWSLLRSRETVLEWAVQARGVTGSHSIHASTVLKVSLHRGETPRYTATRLVGAPPAFTADVANDVSQVA